MVSKEEILKDNKIPIFSLELSEVEKIAYELVEDKEYQGFLKELSAIRKNPESVLLESIEKTEFDLSPDRKLNPTVLYEELKNVLSDLQEELHKIEEFKDLTENDFQSAAKTATLRMQQLESIPVDGALVKQYMESFTFVHKLQDNSILAMLPVDNGYGRLYIHNLATGSPQLYSLKESTVETVLWIDIIAEIFFLFIGLTGIIFTPKPNTKVLWNIWRRLVKNREFRRALKVFEEITRSNASYAEKIAAFVKLLDAIRKDGALGTAVTAFTDGLTGWDILLIILQLIATLAALSNPATGSIKTGQIIGIAAVNIATIVTKVQKLPE